MNAQDTLVIEMIEMAGPKKKKPTIDFNHPSVRDIRS